MSVRESEKGREGQRRERVGVSATVILPVCIRLALYEFSTTSLRLSSTTFACLHQQCRRSEELIRGEAYLTGARHPKSIVG